jgi:hypothetical protein
MRRLSPRIVLAAALCASTLAACAATGAHPSAPPSASVSATAAGEAHESGRTLTQAQLLSAGLALSQWPKDIDRPTDSGPIWQAPQYSTPPHVPAACQPLVDLRWGTSGASAQAAMAFALYNSALNGEVDLASYPPGRASVFFASVRHAVGACPGFSYTNEFGTYDEKIVPLQGPHLGDDTITFGVRLDLQGTAILNRYDYVRVGATTVLIRQNATVAVPAGVSTLLAPQVAKLQATQS